MLMTKERQKLMSKTKENNLEKYYTVFASLSNNLSPVIKSFFSKRSSLAMSAYISDVQRDRFKESLEVRYNNHLQVLKEGFSSTGRELVLEQKKIFLIEPFYSVESNTQIEVEYT